MPLTAEQTIGFTVLGVVIAVLILILGTINALQFAYNNGFCAARGGEYVGNSSCVVEDHVVIIDPEWRH